MILVYAQNREHYPLTALWGPNQPPSATCKLGFFMACQLSRLIPQSLENNNNHCGLKFKQSSIKVIDKKTFQQCWCVIDIGLANKSCIH